MPVSNAHSGVDFANELTQTEYFNIIEYLYFYNGGGIAVGDINKDGLEDIYFTANQLQNRLYLNKGGFTFEDITEKAGVAGAGNWKTGATMADVNGDGYLDIFVCGVGNYKFLNGRNQLLINNGDLTFSDMTEAYGLSFQGFSTHASFFDYDNDGDLDMYLLNHSVHSVRSYGLSTLRNERDSLAGDRLYRNERIPTGQDRFTDVTAEAGIFSSQVGYGLGVGVSDVNLDGHLDIYVSNDFHENDYLYINQGDGKFQERIKESVSHTSRFSMGNDIADINNDGLPDIITLDMLPRDEAVIKTTAGEDPYDIYKFKLGFGYHHQFTRNTLQLNRGLDRKGNPLFSDIAPLAGVEGSDWSWAPLLADFDNDGNKDLFISNGILTRPNDMDYINFISSDSAQRNYQYETFISNMPSGKVPNFFFRSTGTLAFKDVSREWIGVEPGLSSGAAYADLDNDGDLDLIVNNINRKASLYRNDSPPDSSGWLQINLKGNSPNSFGIGTKVMVYTSDRTIYQEQMLSRGWQSSVSPVLHIGIGSAKIDSMHVIWPNRKFQTLVAPQMNSRITVSQNEAGGVWDYTGREYQTLLQPRTAPEFVHRENDYNAFNAEKLIPHMISTQGPKISVGDVNADGLDDFFVGGAAGQPGQIFVQERNGNFAPDLQPAIIADSVYEDVGSAFFDADGNGTLDLIVVSGGQEFAGNHHLLLPRLYLNEGPGLFRKAVANLPEIFLNASCVKPADVDADGDIDLFIGGRVVAAHYGSDPESYLLINDGHGLFTDESHRFNQAIGSNHLGMVTDALWDDLNADGKPDLLLVGEWMPITALIQQANGTFVEQSAEYGLENTEGWWNTLAAGDFDNDGDTDFVAGNLGVNSRLRASPEEPVTLYAGDMDENGGIDHLLTYFNSGEQHPFISRDQLVKQVPSLRRNFLKYSNFRKVQREDIIQNKDTGKFVIKRASILSSVYLENQNGKFVARPLAAEAQMFPIFSFWPGDFNRDGHGDLLAVGNLYAVQPDFGRYDAGYGLMMLGDGKGTFQPVPQYTSGFLVQGEGRSIQMLRTGNGRAVYLVSRNSDSLLLFE